MSTGIQWTDETWNPTRGCSIVSAGCTNCYAMGVAHRFSGEGQPYEGLTRKSGGRPVWTGDVRLVPEKLDEPLRWRKPRRIFVDSMSDLFHPDVPDEYIVRVFDVMRQCSRHTFQILTKRPERMADFCRRLRFDGSGAGTMWLAATDREGGYPVMGGNGATGMTWVWLGTSVENQEAANERIPHLLRCPAAVRFLSCEPLLGPIDLSQWIRPVEHGTIVFTTKPQTHPEGAKISIITDLIHWVIVGGESGPRARPCDVQWFRDIRDQCREAGVPVFVKQLGAQPTAHEPDDTYSPYIELRDSHGGDPAQWPEDLRVREFPLGAA